MKKLICSILCLLVVLFSFPVIAFADSYIYNNGSIDVPIVRQYSSSNGTCTFDTNTISMSFNDNSTGFHYSVLVGTSNKIDFTNVNYVKVSFINATMTGDVCACVCICSSRGTYRPSDAPFYEQQFFNGTKSILLNTSSVSGEYYLDFGITSHPESVSPATAGNNYTGTASCQIASCELLSSSGSGGSGSGSGSSSVDLTPTNNLISALGDKLDDLTDEIVSSNSSLSNISSKVNTIQSDLASVKSNVSSISSSVSQGGYIASRINTLQSDVGTIKNNISTITTSVSEGGYIASRINTLQSDVGTIKNNISTITTSVSEGGYIASRINTIQSDIAVIKTNIGNLNSVLGATGYIGSRINTISDNLSQLISVMSTKLDNINSNLSLINQDLTRTVNAEPSTTLYRKIDDFYTYFYEGFSESWYNAMSIIIDEITTFHNTTFPAFITTLNTRFNELYNVIIYGDKRGGQDIQNEKQQVEEFSEDLDDISSHLDDASSVINGASTGVASYIQTFTDFYNGVTALNAGLSAVFLFALVFIFVKKAIGR